MKIDVYTIGILILYIIGVISYYLQYKSEVKRHREEIGRARNYIRTLEKGHIPRWFKKSGIDGEAYFYPVYIEEKYCGDLVLFDDGRVELMKVLRDMMES